METRTIDEPRPPVRACADPARGGERDAKRKKKMTNQTHLKAALYRIPPLAPRKTRFRAGRSFVAKSGDQAVRVQGKQMEARRVTLTIHLAVFIP